MSTFDIEAVMEIEHSLGKGAKKPVDDAAPKRPLSAFFLWANKMRPSVMKENSDASVGQIGKILGMMWKKTTSSDRESYESKAEKGKKVYHSKMERYKKTSSYKNFQLKMLAWKIHETKKPYPKDQNAPKRNLSAYLLYGASVRSKIVKENPDIAAAEILKEQAVWWKSLSTKDRKPWLEKAEAEKVKYQKKVARYMKTSDYQSWATGRDEYKKMMLEKRNKLMGIRKRARSESKPGSVKKQKRTARRSRTPKASRRRSSSGKSRMRSARRSRTPKASKMRSSSRRSSKRRARTPKAPKRSSRSSSRRRSTRRRASRRSRTPKSSSRSRSRRSSKRRSKRMRSPKRSRSAKRRSAKRSTSRRKSKAMKAD